MFKKKSSKNSTNFFIESKLSENDKDIHSKLQYLILRNNKNPHQIQQQKITIIQPLSFFSKQCSQYQNLQQKKFIHKSPIQGQIKRFNQQKKTEQLNSISFEDKLKNLMKIAYQKQKQIEKLKKSIKNSRTNPLNQCKICSNTRSKQIIECRQLNLNIEQIKQIIKKTIELQTKQQQLHIIIDLLAQKEQKCEKKNKQLSIRNKQLLIINEQLIVLKQNLFKKIQNQQKQNKQLKQEIKQKNQQILKLNRDIMTIIQHSKSIQNQMSQNIYQLQQKIYYSEIYFKQNQKELQRNLEKYKVKISQLIEPLKGNRQQKNNLKQQTNTLKAVDTIINRQHLVQSQRQSQRNYKYKIRLLQAEKSLVNRQVIELKSIMFDQKKVFSLNIQQLIEEKNLEKQAQKKLIIDQNQFNLSNLATKHQNEMIKIVKEHEKQLSIMKQKIFIKETQLQKCNIQICQLIKQLQNTHHQLSIKDIQLIKAKQSLSQTNQKIFKIQTELNLANLLLKKNQIKLQHDIIKSNLLEKTLKPESQQYESRNKNQSRNQNLMQCQHCYELQMKLKHNTKNSKKQVHKDSHQIISLPTISNISQVEFFNSSFQCKLQQLVQFSSRKILQERQNFNIDQQKIKKVSYCQLQQNKLKLISQKEDSSFIRYQEELLKQLQKQCQQPTLVFLEQNNRSKILELSEIKQNLKMTKQVNFQLFDEINRKQKIINQLKDCFILFTQSQKTSQNYKEKIGLPAPIIPKQIIKKIQNLLLLK